MAVEETETAEKSGTPLSPSLSSLLSPSLSRAHSAATSPPFLILPPPQKLLFTHTHKKKLLFVSLSLLPPRRQTLEQAQKLENVALFVPSLARPRGRGHGAQRAPPPNPENQRHRSGNPPKGHVGDMAHRGSPEELRRRQVRQPGAERRRGGRPGRREPRLAIKGPPPPGEAPAVPGHQKGRRRPEQVERRQRLAVGGAADGGEGQQARAVARGQQQRAREPSAVGGARVDLRDAAPGGRGEVLDALQLMFFLKVREDLGGEE